MPGSQFLGPSPAAPYVLTERLEVREGSTGSGLTLRSLICKGLASECRRTCISCKSSPSGRGLVTSSAASFAASSNYSKITAAEQDKRKEGESHKRKVICRETGEFISKLRIKAGQVLHGDRQFVLTEVVVAFQLLPISGITGTVAVQTSVKHCTYSCTRSRGPRKF